MRILFSTTPGEGHVRPLLPLARALRARGHEIAFATAAGWAPRLAEDGFDVLPAGLEHVDARRFLPLAELRKLPPAERRAVGFPRIFGVGHAPGKLPQLLEHARTWRADVVLHESGDLAAPVAAAALGLPVVHHGFGAMIPLAVLDRAAETVAPLWREHGLAPDPHAGAFRGLYVDICPPSFVRDEPLGPSMHLRPAERRRGKPAHVYATMGTIWNDAAHFRLLLEALAGLTALVTTGHGVDPAGLGAVPDGVRVERFVPQDEVLPDATAVISHGGSGTTLGALAHGLPLVLVPQGADQFDNAVLCREAGVAIVLPPDADAASIRAALDRVLDEPGFRERAEELAAEIAAMPSPDEVAERVEAHAGAG